MRLGMIGLGKMGKSMARRLMNGGHDLVVFAAFFRAGFDVRVVSQERRVDRAGRGAVDADFTVFHLFAETARERFHSAF